MAIVMEHVFSIDNTYDNWERFKNHRLKTTTDSETNVVLIGNSKLFRGVDTSLLNQMSSESGCGLRFYNAGFPGMSGAELINNLDSVAANQNFNPNYVLFMPSVFQHKSQLLSQRRRNNALIRLWHVQMLNLHANNKPLRAYKNLHLSMLQRGFNKSKLIRKLISNDIEQKVSLETSLQVQSNAGYISLDEDPKFGLDNRRHLQFLNTPEFYQTLASKLRLAMQSSITEELSRPVLLEETSNLNISAKTLLHIFVKKIKLLGAEPVALFFPQDSGSPEHGYYQEILPKMKQVASSRDEIAQFINKDLWYDHKHLKRRGAKLFTKIVYKQMCHNVSN